MDNNFESKLAAGIAGEDIVYNYLIANNSLVEDLRKQVHEEYSGPCLRGTEGKIVLPDFAVYNKNPAKGSFTVDSKVKTSVYTLKGKKCFTVDNKFEQYRRATEIKKLDYLKIIFIYNGKMYSYRDNEYFDTIIFNNEHSTGLVYLFEFNEKKWVY